MLDKYFGFVKIDSENSVIDSLIEHTRIDEEELFLLKKMVCGLIERSPSLIEESHLKIVKIRSESNQAFEHTEEQIIQAKFNYQKQYDLLRIYQRIETISCAILATSDMIMILSNLNNKLPSTLNNNFNECINLIIKNHNCFKDALFQYEKNKDKVFHTIHKSIEIDKVLSEYIFRSIDSLYKHANNKDLALGDFRAIENIINHFRSLSKKIEEAATSLEWLLIN